MSKEFEQYLTSCTGCGVSEKEFMEVIKLFPKLENYSLGLEINSTQEEIANELLMENFVNKYLYAYCDEININDQSVYIHDIDYTNDLIHLAEELSEYGWKIANFNELKEDLEEEENRDKREELLSIIETKFSLSELEKIVKEYDYKK